MGTGPGTLFRGACRCPGHDTDAGRRVRASRRRDLGRADSCAVCPGGCAGLSRHRDRRRGRRAVHADSARTGACPRPGRRGRLCRDHAGRKASNPARVPRRPARKLCRGSHPRLSLDAANPGRTAAAASRRADHVGAGRRHRASGSSAGERHRDAAGSRWGPWRTGASVLFGDSSRGNARHEPGAGRAALPGAPGQVLHDPRAVHTCRWRRRRAFDGLSQDSGTLPKSSNESPGRRRVH